MAFDTLPGFDVMQGNCPTGPSPDVLGRLFPRQDTAWITNTCTVRISHVLNQSGLAIPKPPTTDHGILMTSAAGDAPGHAAALHVTRNLKQEQFGYRVREMIPYVQARFGPAGLTDASPASSGRKARFAGKKGPIAFVVAFKDATGHIDLWDGADFNMEPDPDSHHDYFVMARTILFWPSA